MTGSQVRVLFAAPASLQSRTVQGIAGRRTCGLKRLRDLPHIPLFPLHLVSSQRQATNAENRRLQMRKFILITAMVLASASAQAGVSRGLTLASNDEPAAAAEQAKEAPKETPKEAPKTVETP